MGAYVTPSTIISSIRDINQLKLTFTVQERYSSRIKQGEMVEFTIDGSDKKYAATIIATENNISTETRSMMVKALVKSNNSKLISGTFAKVQIAMGTNETAFMIPTQAIIPQARGKKVFLLKDGLATLQTVTTGVRDTSTVEINSGLKNGDTVLISGLLSTKPGSKVKIKNIKNN
jgi:membrane fusion protein (multidrug efflux system)